VEGSLPPFERARSPLGVKLRAPYSLKAGKKASLALYALEGTAMTPSWAEAGADPAAARDDDLLTSWSCTRSGEARPCGLGLALPEEAEVHIIRLFPGAGTSHAEFRAHARPRKVRVHTDMGWADASVKRGWDHRHILLPAGIVTRTVAIEILETRPGRTDSSVHVAELELFGVSGKARGPFEIEPRAAIVRFESRAWKDEDEELATVTPSFVELADGRGGARRLVRGTGLAGRPGDRFMLVERATGMHCPRGSYHTSSGAYTLVDTKTRLFWDVGALGGVRALVFRHPEAIGFATARRDGSEVDPAGGVLVEGNMFRMLGDREAAFESAEDVAAWGFTEAGVECCPSADASGWQECKQVAQNKARKLLAGLGGQSWETFWLEHEESSPGGWMRCRLEDTVHLLVYLPEECDPAPSVLVTLDPSGKILDWRMSGSLRPGAELAYRRLVEAANGDGGSILRIGEAGKIEELYPDALFSLHTPTLCACFMNQGPRSPLPGA
jgi:hypothetical protein